MSLKLRVWAAWICWARTCEFSWGNSPIALRRHQRIRAGFLSESIEKYTENLMSTLTIVFPRMGQEPVRMQNACSRVLYACTWMQSANWSLGHAASWMEQAKSEQSMARIYLSDCVCCWCIPLDTFGIFILGRFTRICQCRPWSPVWDKLYSSQPSSPRSSNIF